MTRPPSPLSLCGAGAVYLYKWSVYEKRLFALAGALLLLASGNISAEAVQAPTKKPITYGNVAIPEIHKKRKKKN